MTLEEQIEWLAVHIAIMLSRDEERPVNDFILASLKELQELREREESYKAIDEESQSVLKAFKISVKSIRGE